MRFGYHYGFLVFDLEEAMPRFESGFGLVFREPEARALRPAAGHAGAVPAGAEIRFSFSVSDVYPYVELIEATESGLFGRQEGEGLHHVGYWVAAMAAVKAEQNAAGLATEASFEDEDGTERVFYVGDGQIRVESVNARLQPDYATWLASGEPRRS